MKKSILFLFLMASTSVLFGQGILNPSFETWTSFTASGGSGEYPTGWTTSDSLTKASGGVQTAWRGLDPYEGANSLHLKSAVIIFQGFNVAGPAVATNGIVSLNGFALAYSGGHADTTRARYYSGQYKYIPVGGDSGIVKVFLLKRNGSVRDTIAAGSTSLEASATYRQFMVTMNFRDFTVQPDTALIIMQSANTALALGSTVNESELVIDSLTALGFVGVEELSGDVKSFSVYPSPASSFITLDAELRNPATLSYDLFDNNGRWIRSDKMNSSKETIEISDLAVVNYIVKLNASGKMVTAKQFSVNR